jgi:acyl carrier protein
MSEIESEGDMRQQIWEWISQHSKAPDQALAYDTPLIESGHLDSAGVLELVFFLEELGGREIDVDDLNPESFADINSISRNFLASPE